MSHVITVIVSIELTYLPQLDAVSSQLQRQGLEVQQVLRTLGQVIGQVAEDRMEELSKVSGVLSVDREQRYTAT